MTILIATGNCYGQKPPKTETYTKTKELEYLDSIERFRSTNNTKQQILTSYHLAQRYVQWKRYTEAAILFNSALAIHHAPDAELDTIKPYFYLAFSYCHFYLGNFSETILSLEKASKSLEALPSGNKVKIFNLISLLWLSMPEAYQPVSYKKALYYLQLAEPIARKENNISGLTDILNNEGHTYMKLRDWAKSEEKLRQSIALARKSNPNGLSTPLLSLGETYLEQGKYNKALPFLREAHRINSTDGNYAYGTLKLAETYVHLNDLKNAEMLISEAEKTAKEQHRNTLIMDIYKVKSELKTRQGNYSEALACFKKYSIMEDTLNFKAIVKNLQTLDVKYHTSVANRKLLERQLFIKKQSLMLDKKNNQILMLILILSITAISILALYNRHIQQRKSLEQRSKIDLLMATVTGEEKERQRIARELHDGIGGMLAVVNMNFLAAQKHNFKNGRQNIKISQMVAKVATEVHRAACNLQPTVLEECSLEKAIRILCDEISHDTNPIKIDFAVHGNLPPIDKAVNTTIYRIIQELLQNIIKHSEATHIVIIMKKNDAGIAIHIEDNGKGFGVRELEKKSLGIKTIQNRVSELGGTLKLSSEIGVGTAASMFFDL